MKGRRMGKKDDGAQKKSSSPEAGSHKMKKIEG